MSNLFKRILSSIILLPLVLYFLLSGSLYLIFFTIICFLVASYEWNKIAKKTNFKILGLIILIFSFYTFYKVGTGYFWPIVLIICISTDIGGYLFGKLFGGPKLIKISPNKTYAGMFGGYFLSLIFILYYLNRVNMEISVGFIIMLILLSTASQVGDIIISYFKRLSKVKDTGKIIPGHGGLLDRIDGMIFAFPIFYIIEITGYLF